MMVRVVLIAKCLLEKSGRTCEIGIPENAFRSLVDKFGAGFDVVSPILLADL